MAFHFPLAAVLRYRESRERREYLALESIQRDIIRVETQIREVEEAYSVATQSRTKELSRGSRAATIQSEYQYQKTLEQRREALESLLMELKIKWRQQLSCYDLARRNRETLEKLREKQLDTFNREQSKREQNILDDLFLSRRGRRN
jgi:flagellar FliJ protein